MDKERDVLIEKIKKMKFAYKTEEKIKFLLKDVETRPIKTITFYIAGIRYLNKAEEDNGREWEDFTPTMLDNALYAIDATSLNSLCSITTVIRDYLFETRVQTIEDKYAYKRTMTLTSEELEGYVNTAGQELKYLIPSEFDDIIFNRPGDSMCKSIFILLYYGVKGKSFKDIQELKIENINFETGEIYNDNGDLLATIPKRYIYVLKEASEEELFTMYNVDGSIKRQKILIQPTGYLLRTVQWRTTKNKKPTKLLISNMLDEYLSCIGNEYVTGQSIYNSGEVYRFLKHYGIERPTGKMGKEWREWRELTGSTLSYATMFSASKIILKKLGLWDENND